MRRRRRGSGCGSRRGHRGSVDASTSGWSNVGRKRRRLRCGGGRGGERGLLHGGGRRARRGGARERRVAAGGAGRRRGGAGAAAEGGVEAGHLLVEAGLGREALSVPARRRGMDGAAVADASRRCVGRRDGLRQDHSGLHLVERRTEIRRHACAHLAPHHADRPVGPGGQVVVPGLAGAHLLWLLCAAHTGLEAHHAARGRLVAHLLLHAGERGGVVADHRRRVPHAEEKGGGPRLEVGPAPGEAGRREEAALGRRRRGRNRGGRGEA
mmetsp:Transcript_70964/g.230372  ORF Transcript_70964/g.230372 Transcript_70964/m.230372 type:complete len:268 (-) Transcript_70964:3029-3832(-)